MRKLRPGAAKLKKNFFKKEMFSKITKMWSRAERGATPIITAAAVPLLSPGAVTSVVL